MNNFKWWMQFYKFFMFSATGDDDGGEVDLDDVQADETDDDAAIEEPKTMLEALQQEIGTVEAPKAEEKPETKPEVGADGKPIVKEEAKPEQTPEQKAAAEAKKLITDDDLKTPEGLGAKAQQRFQKLADGYKETQTQLTEANNKVQDLEARYTQQAEANMEFVNAMDAVGAGPENLNTFIDYMGHIKNGDLEKAHAILSAELHQISLRMGKELPGVDLLKNYPDLLADVENLDMSRERAIEIAKARDLQAQTTRQNENANKKTQAETQQQQELEQFEQLKQTAYNDIDKSMNSLKEKDIDYPAKERIIMESKDGKPSILERIVKNNHPSQWLNALHIAYDAIQVPRTAPRRQTTNALNPSSGGGEAAPGTMLEAIRQGLSY